MKRSETGGLSDNEQFEGYCADLAEMLADKLQFRYQLRVVSDSMYGVRLDNGSWNGMVGELTRQVRETYRQTDTQTDSFTSSLVVLSR